MPKALRIFLYLLPGLLPGRMNAQSSWAGSFGGTYNIMVKDIQVNSQLESYVIGDFEYNVDADPGPGLHTLSSAGGGDIFISALAPDGALLWARRIGGTGEERSCQIALDQQGNVYVVGAFAGTVDFDPGPGSFALTANGVTNAFILKLNGTGDFQWACRFPAVFASAIDVTTDGFVYTTGAFRTPGDFDPGPTTFMLTKSGSDDDLFLAKLDTAGNFIWAAGAGGAELDRPNALCTDASGAIYLTGQFLGKAYYPVGSNTDSVTSAGLADVFVAKFWSDGSGSWIKRVGGRKYDNATAIATDPAGNVLLTGEFADTVDFDPGAGVEERISTGIANAFLLKLDNNGNLLWTKTFGEECLTFDLVVTGNDEIVVTGSFAIDFTADGHPFRSAGNTDAFLSRLDAQGNFKWVKSIGGPMPDYNMGIAVAPNGDLFACGLYQQSVRFAYCDYSSTFFGVGGINSYVSRVKASCYLGAPDTPTAEGEVRIYPIPCEGSLTVDFAAGPTPGTLFIVAADGKVVRRLSIGGSPLTIDLSGLPNGVYAIRSGDAASLPWSERILVHK